MVPRLETPPPRRSPASGGSVHAASLITLPRSVIVLLVATSAASLLAVAFAVGRLSAPRTTGTTSSPQPQTEGLPSATLDSPRTQTTSPLESTAAEVRAEATTSDREPRGGSPPGAISPSGDGAAVAAYFDQMEALAAATRTAQNPETLAQKILDQVSSGDTSQVDALLATQRSLRSRMEEIHAPPSCRRHQEASLRLMDRAITLLDRTRGALTSPDPAALMSIAAEGHAIESEAKAVDAMAADLRRAAGLPQDGGPPAATDAQR